MVFSMKGKVLPALFLAAVWSIAAFAGTLNVGVIALSLLLVAAAKLAFQQDKKQSSINLGQEEKEESEELGSSLNELIDDIQDWADKRTPYNLYYDIDNSMYKTYEVPDIESNKHLMASVIMRHEATQTDIHIAIELTTGTIVQHGKVQDSREYIWPQDYVSLFESRLEGNRMRNKQSINQKLLQLAEKNGQLSGNYSQLVVDQDEVDPAVMEAEGGG